MAAAARDEICRSMLRSGGRQRGAERDPAAGCHIGEDWRVGGDRGPGACPGQGFLSVRGRVGRGYGSGVRSVTLRLGAMTARTGVSAGTGVPGQARDGVLPGSP